MRIPTAAILLVWGSVLVAQALPVWWAPSLHLERLDQIPSKLQASDYVAGEQVTLRKWDRSTSFEDAPTRQPHTCAEYLGARDEGYVPATNMDSAFESFYMARCYALRYLAAARPASRTFLSHDGWSAAALDELPPLGLVVERPTIERWKAAVASGASWRTWQKTAHVKAVRGDTLDVEEEGMAYSLEIVARADFNGDGIEDMLVAEYANATQGSLKYSSVFVLTRLATGGPMRILALDGQPFEP